ncbi:MAG: EamA family transporter [Alphaproteobacteria bacterium]|nr:EamA family transporter [Alphaproteobacteria bacterium]
MQPHGMELWVAGMVLLAATLHASWNALIKVQGDRIVGIAVMNLAWLLPGGVAAAVLPLPSPAAVPFIAASFAIHIVYFWALARAYQFGDFGQVYPIARGTAPLLVAIGAYAVADERLSPASMAGVGLVAAGIAALAFVRARVTDGRAVLAAFVTAGTIGAYSIVDGLGARASGNAHSYAAWLFLSNVPPIAAWCVWRFGLRGFLERARPSLRAGVPAGILSAVSYWLAMWAMTLAPLGLVVALRETSVVIAAIIGAVVLREGFGPRRIAAATLVAAGVALIKLGG